MFCVTFRDLGVESPRGGAIFLYSLICLYIFDTFTFFIYFYFPYIYIYVFFEVFVFEEIIVLFVIM